MDVPALGKPWAVSAWTHVTWYCDMSTGCRTGSVAWVEHTHWLSMSRLVLDEGHRFCPELVGSRALWRRCS